MKEIITCVIGTFAFSVLLNAPPRLLPLTTLGGFLSALIFTLLDTNGMGTFSATLLAMAGISIYSEIFARIFRTPVTVLLLPSAIPLLPGSSIYYAMSYVVNYDRQLFFFYAAETLKAGIGMGLGAVIIGTVMNIIWKNVKIKR